MWCIDSILLLLWPNMGNAFLLWWSEVFLELECSFSISFHIIVSDNNISYVTKINFNKLCIFHY